MKALLIDDDELLLHMLTFWLESEGCLVVATTTGKEAMEKLKSEAFDLVITDLLLPDVTGLEIVVNIKSTQPELPVIVLSSANEEKTIRETLELGAADFITKPFSPADFSKRIRRFSAQKPTIL